MTSAARSKSLNIVLGVSGGIAAYKVASILRLLTEAGHNVQVVPTQAALNFVGSATWEALSGNPLISEVWDDVADVPHVRIGKAADLVLVAPSTADLLSRAANGAANDLLTNVLLTATCPIFFAPSMHTEMWLNAATQENVATLRSRGSIVIDPADGRLTGSDSGPGRLPEAEEIVSVALGVLSEQDLLGQEVVITAGGTREPIDAVRVIANRSTGKQGYAIASEAVSRGAKVTLISTADLPTPFGVNLVQVETAQQMMEAVNAEAKSADVVVMAAAVADVRPVQAAMHKLKKDPLTGLICNLGAIELEATPDILAGLGKCKPAGQVLVGFAAETENLVANAQSKLERKGADLIVANDVSQAGVGFAHATNAVTLVARGTEPVEVALADKRSIARSIVNAVVAIRSARTN